MKAVKLLFLVLALFTFSSCFVFEYYIDESYYVDKPKTNSKLDLIWVEHISEINCKKVYFLTLERAVSSLTNVRIKVYDAKISYGFVTTECNKPSGIIYNVKIKKRDKNRAVSNGWIYYYSAAFPYRNL